MFSKTPQPILPRRLQVPAARAVLGSTRFRRRLWLPKDSPIITSTTFLLAVPSPPLISRACPVPDRVRRGKSVSCKAPGLRVVSRHARDSSFTRGATFPPVSSDGTGFFDTIGRLVWLRDDKT